MNVRFLRRTWLSSFWFKKWNNPAFGTTTYQKTYLLVNKLEMFYKVPSFGYWIHFLCAVAWGWPFAVGGTGKGLLCTELCTMYQNLHVSWFSSEVIFFFFNPLDCVVKICENASGKPRYIFIWKVKWTILCQMDLDWKEVNNFI